MIKALWIDDRSMLQEDGSLFTALAKKSGIEITNAVTVDDGMAYLYNPRYHFDAIILDINCYLHDAREEAPDQSALSYAKEEILKRNHLRGIDTPYFIYSALDTRGIDIVNLVVPKINPWDNRKIYHKPKDVNALFEAIKEAVRNSGDYQIKSRYNDAFGIVSDAGILELLKEFEKEGSGRNLSVIRKIRPLFEELATYLHNAGLVRLDEALKIQGKDRSANIIKDCSAYIDLEDWRRKFVPTHIKRLFHFVSQCANESEHYYGKMDIKDEEVENKLVNMLPTGAAPYLNKLMVYSFLEILAWVKRLPVKDEHWKESWRNHFNKLAEEKLKTTPKRRGGR